LWRVCTLVEFAKHECATASSASMGVSLRKPFVGRCCWNMRKSRRIRETASPRAGSAAQPPPPSALNRADLIPGQYHATPLGGPINEACQAMPRHLITLKTVLGPLWFSWALLLVDQRSSSCSWMKLITQRGRSAQQLCCELPLASGWPECCATSARLESWSAGCLASDLGQHYGDLR
jgi:hypothetical protein